MIIIVVSILIVALAVVLALAFVKEGPKEPEQGRSVSAESDFSRRLLFTETEAKFYHVLRGLLPEGYEVWGKLGLWAVVSSKTSWARISQKQIDFVIVQNGPVPDAVLIIELDDYSHRRKSAQKRDAEKDAILERAGLPVLRVPVASDYDVEDLRTKIQTFINP